MIVKLSWRIKTVDMNQREPRERLSMPGRNDNRQDLGPGGRGRGFVTVLGSMQKRRQVWRMTLFTTRDLHTHAGTRLTVCWSTFTKFTREQCIHCCSGSVLSLHYNYYPLFLSLLFYSILHSSLLL